MCVFSMCLNEFIAEKLKQTASVALKWARMVWYVEPRCTRVYVVVRAFLRTLHNMDRPPPLSMTLVRRRALCLTTATGHMTVTNPWKRAY
jgi:hypothetical protein